MPASGSGEVNSLARSGELTANISGVKKKNLEPQ